MTAAIYWPGLIGPFLFDDIPNLSILEQLDQFDTFNRSLQFVLGGTSGPTGRPISLLSFLINDNAWPTDPWGFKYTGLMIHLLNGVLVYTFIRKLLIITNVEIRASEWTALLVSALWLTQPLNTSTVLYVIQRMTELSALFNLALLTLYLYLRGLIPERPKTGYFLLTLSFLILVQLSVLSKENGALIFVYLFVLESILYREATKGDLSSFKIWKTFFITLPALCIISYIAYLAFKAPSILPNRDFNFYERVLTESRILLDYLGQIIIPRLGNGGLFHDDYVISKSLFTPVSTVIAIGTIIFLLFMGFATRKRAPLFSLAIAWFFSGHLMESTVLPLELYFEHRNYLPMIGPLLFVAYIGVKHYKTHKPLIISLFSCLLFASTFSVYQNSIIWGNPLVASRVWASEHPTSIRARQAAASFALMNNDHNEAEKQLTLALGHHPNDASLILQTALIQCTKETLTLDDISAIQLKMKSSKYSHASASTLIQFAQIAMKGECGALNTNEMINIFKATSYNPSFKQRTTQHMLHYWLGQMYANQRLLSPAMDSLDKAHQLQPVIDIPLLQATWLSTAGLYDDALTYISLAREMDKRAKNPLLRNSKKRDIDNLEQLIINAKNNSRINNDSKDQ